MDAGTLEDDASMSGDDASVPGDDAFTPIDLGTDAPIVPIDTGPTCTDQCMGTTAIHCVGGVATRTDCTLAAPCTVVGGMASCVPICTPGTVCSTDGTSVEKCDATSGLEVTPCPRGCVAGACRAEVACGVTVGPTITVPGSLMVDTCGARDDDTQLTTHGDCPDHGPNGEDVVLRLDVDRTERVTITATDVDGGRPIDPCIYVRTACADASSEVECNDDGASTALDALISDLVLTPGEYFLVVDEFYWNDGATHYTCGMIQVDVTVAPL